MNYKISDIDGIIPIAYDRIRIVFKEGDDIETTDIHFNDDGTFELGYIFQ